MSNSNGISSEKYTAGSMVVDFFDKKPKDFVKALGTAASWFSLTVQDAPKEVKKFGAATSQIKNFLGATEIPRKAREAWNSFKGFWSSLTGTNTAKTTEAGQKAIKDGCSLTNSMFDGVSFTQKFVPLSAQVMKNLGGVNNVATLAGSAIGAAEQVSGLINAKEGETTKKLLHCINVARDISYLTLGAAGLFFLFTATAVVPWFMLACATSGLVFTITGFFYEKVYDPEGKGKDLDPGIVIRNKILNNGNV